MNNLTPKQEKFCQHYVKHGNKSDAYRYAYNASNMQESTINEKATRISQEYKLSTRIDELRKAIANKELYTLEQSIRNDLELIKNYKDAIDTLGNKEALEIDIEVAERTIKFIGVTGYSQAQDRISKQSGFYEKDNTQKVTEVKILTNNPLNE